MPWAIGQFFFFLFSYGKASKAFILSEKWEVRSDTKALDSVWDHSICQLLLLYTSKRYIFFCLMGRWLNGKKPSWFITPTSPEVVGSGSGTPHYCPDMPHAMSKSGLSGSGQWTHLRIPFFFIKKKKKKRDIFFW